MQSVARSRTDGESLHLTYTLLLLARARGMAGELHEGRAATREGVSLSHRRNQRYLEAELWRVDGELAYRRGESDAVASLRRAVEVADGQGASWLALRLSTPWPVRYPDHALREQLGDLLETIPSGHDLPAFRAATGLGFFCLSPQKGILGVRTEATPPGNAEAETHSGFRPAAIPQRQRSGSPGGLTSNYTFFAGIGKKPL